jgi:hypothetical protein
MSTSSEYYTRESVDRSIYYENDKLILELVHVAYKNVVKLNVFAPWLCVYLYQVDNLYAGESTPLLSHPRTWNGNKARDVPASA